MKITPDQAQPLLRVAKGFLDGLHGTLRVQFFGKEHLETRYQANEPIVLAFWHNMLLMLPYFYDGPFIPHALISESTDGEYIAQVCKTFGIESIRGSTSKGGARALKQCVRVSRSGGLVGVTPDGPRGPRYAVQGGIVAIAQITGRPIVPICYSASRMWELNSWDRFRIPKPFAHLAVVVGEPLFVPRRLDAHGFEAYRSLLQERMRQDVETADSLVRRI